MAETAQLDPESSLGQDGFEPAIVEGDGGEFRGLIDIPVRPVAEPLKSHRGSCAGRLRARIHQESGNEQAAAGREHAEGLARIDSHFFGRQMRRHRDHEGEVEAVVGDRQDQSLAAMRPFGL